MRITESKAKSRLGRAAVVVAGSLSLVASGGFAANADPTHENSNNNNSQKLRTAVSPESVMGHLGALNDIAAAHDGTRASGTEGYKASVDYIVENLRAAGYDPELQAFEFPFYAELSPAVLAKTAPVATDYSEDDYETMTFSGSGEITAAVSAVDTDGTAGASDSGCEADDFAGFTAGSIALIQRGSCTFAQKAINAEQADASAVIIFNSGAEGATEAVIGTLGSPAVTIPVVGASHAVGNDLLGDGVEAHVKVDTISETRVTWNVFAETASGNPDNVVMVGGHLDGVLAGAGINDNGTGSAAILSVAEAMQKVKTENKVRFAWWGAEELGLLGAEHYVADLAAKGELDEVGLYLNFDMIGSPNYGRFVYDGDNSAFPVGPGAAEGPEGSGEIEQDFHDYFASQGLASGETAFSGRSDYGPFIAEGIPAGGLFTGAEGIKTEEQAALFGGQAGVAYDKCYHAACDDLSNVNVQAVDEMSDAVAHLTLTYAMSTVGVNGEGEAVKGNAKNKEKFTGNPLGGGTDSGGGLHPEHGHELAVK
ncbi:M20/M25/M40 family metallo-hydrolase [Arthrobacter sp. H14]|uniref:M20/M25/M40 family metallo-hydrolase n=1 Tax=Arthrobacter sp. H14 TaxID=1312959 RepID=UPI0004BBEB12|nr:M20/M25/M40 family metallo-hydrolase [Arthrobacter sp. H14]